MKQKKTLNLYFNQTKISECPSCGSKEKTRISDTNSENGMKLFASQKPLDVTSANAVWSIYRYHNAKRYTIIQFCRSCAGTVKQQIENQMYRQYDLVEFIVYQGKQSDLLPYFVEMQEELNSTVPVN